MGSLATSRHAVLSASAWRALAWAGVAFQAVALLVVLGAGNWAEGWTLAATLVASALAAGLSERVPVVVAFLLALAGSAHGAGLWWGLYDRFVWFDSALHFFTAFALVAALACFFRFDPRGWRTAPRLILFAAIGLLIGIAWELGEVLTMDQESGDTLVDLALDAVGAALAAPFTSRLMARRPVRIPSAE